MTPIEERELRLRVRIDHLLAERDNLRDQLEAEIRRGAGAHSALPEARRSRDMWRARCRDAEWGQQQAERRASRKVAA